MLSSWLRFLDQNDIIWNDKLASPAAIMNDNEVTNFLKIKNFPNMIDSRDILIKGQAGFIWQKDLNEKPDSFESCQEWYFFTSLSPLTAAVIICNS